MYQLSIISIRMATGSINGRITTAIFNAIHLIWNYVFSLTIEHVDMATIAVFSVCDKFLFIFGMTKNVKVVSHTSPRLQDKRKARKKENAGTTTARRFVNVRKRHRVVCFFFFFFVLFRFTSTIVKYYRTR